MTVNLLFFIGVVGTLLNISSILFNIIVAATIFYGRKEILHNPFYKAAIHLIISEILINFAQILIISPCLLIGDDYTLLYVRHVTKYYIANSIMLISDDCYYYLHTFIAIYRFLSMNASPKIQKLFEEHTIHIIALMIWCWCSAEGIYMMLGVCTKLYRPQQHFIGFYCSDEEEGGDPRTHTRFKVILALQTVNMSLPVLSMVIYMCLYVKICCYQEARMVSVQEFNQQEQKMNCCQKFAAVIAASCSITNRNQVRIMYQGLILVMLLSAEPIVNLCYRDAFYSRQVRDAWYQLFSYSLIYSTTITNFLVFFVFNSQMRRRILFLLCNCFGSKQTGTQRSSTMATVSVLN